MEQGKKMPGYERRVTMVDDLPRIFLVSPSEKAQTAKPPVAAKGPAEARKGPRALFFGHHLNNLLTAQKTTEVELQGVEAEMASALDAVQAKLQQSQSKAGARGPGPVTEEMKHQRYMEERNRSQEALSEDILKTHQSFGTGIQEAETKELYDFLRNEAEHEGNCSAGEPIHEFIECSIIRYIRGKVMAWAWHTVDKARERANVPFPIPDGLLDSVDPERNERIKEERRKSGQEEWLAMPPRMLAELIFGNVPVWAYSYPARESYLWQLTVLQGVAAGLGANALRKALEFWEGAAPRIVQQVEEEFLPQIKEIRRQSEAATGIGEVFSLSKQIERIGSEEIPRRIWGLIAPQLGIPDLASLES